MLKFFYSNFGITPDEIGNYDDQWIENMIAISNGEGEATSEKFDTK